MFPSWSWILGFVIGACVGSFLNMAIYRLPRNVSFVNPSRSFCPTCKHPLGGVDLLPLLSWLSTGGKCRYCREPVASRYFWVEMLTAFLFSGIWWQYLVVGEAPWTASFYMAGAACLVAIIFIDWEFFIIPDEVNALILFLGIGLHAAQGSLMTALWGALLGWGLLFGIQLLGRLAFKKDAMGYGDIKMMRGVGAMIGPTLIVANIGVAVVLGLVGGIAGILLSKRNAVVDTTPVPEDETPYVPTPVPFVLLAGTWYLLCLDVVAIFVKPLDRWIAAKLPQELVDQDDDWTPSATTIPFGPYLAAGALVCMLFAAPIEKGLRDYFYGPSQGGTSPGGPSQGGTANGGGPPLE